MIVLKFGGSSVADSNAMKQVADIVISSNKKQLVVLSACKGVTDLLIEIAHISVDNFDLALNKVESINLHHTKIIDELIQSKANYNRALEAINLLIDDLKRYVKGINLLSELTPKMLDYCLSFGERLSTTVFNTYLIELNQKSILVDAGWFIKTDSNFNNAKPKFDEINRLINDDSGLLSNSKDFYIIVTQGFIGSDENGNYTTLGRGGSDYSAAIFGNACNAEEIQIWTDVSGIKSADPRNIQEAKTINSMSINEVRELSFFGAKVLHPDTIKPAIDAGIKIKVLNTFSPDDNGTVIENHYENIPQIHSISVKRSIRSINISFRTNSNSARQAYEIIKTLDSNKINILASSFTESSIIFFVENFNNIETALSMLFGEHQITINEGDLCCIVGNNLKGISDSKSISFKILDSIKHIPIKYYLLGSNDEAAFIFSDKLHTDEILRSIHLLIS